MLLFSWVNGESLMVNSRLITLMGDFSFNCLPFTIHYLLFLTIYDSLSYDGSQHRNNRLACEATRICLSFV